MRTPKIRPHNWLISALYDGKPKSVADIQRYYEETKNDRALGLLYKLPAYVWAVRQEGGSILTMKEGKTVLTYQLMNPEKFDEKTGLAHAYVSDIDAKNKERAQRNALLRARQRGMPAPSATRFEDIPEQELEQEQQNDNDPVPEPPRKPTMEDFEASYNDDPVNSKKETMGVVG